MKSYKQELIRIRNPKRTGRNPGHIQTILHGGITCSTNTKLMRVKLSEEERKARKRERNRKYYKANPEKVKEMKRKWREANPEKMKDYIRKYCEANPEKVRERRRKYYEANVEKTKEKCRKYCEANPEKVREMKRKWREANPEKVREYKRKYREANPDKLRETYRKWCEANPERVVEILRKNSRKWRAKNNLLISIKQKLKSKTPRTVKTNRNAPLSSSEKLFFQMMAAPSVIKQAL